MNSYAYMELDFMTTYSPRNLSPNIQYEEMVGEDFISTAATQIFNAAVEAVLHPQDDGPLDQIYYQNANTW